MLSMCTYNDRTAIMLARMHACICHKRACQARWCQDNSRNSFEWKGNDCSIGWSSINGKLIMIGASDESVEISPLLFVSGRRSVIGWASGTSIDSQDALSFSVLSGVQSMNQVFPLESAAEAFELMMNGKARFRAVLTTTHH